MYSPTSPAATRQKSSKPSNSWLRLSNSRICRCAAEITPKYSVNATAAVLTAVPCSSVAAVVASVPSFSVPNRDVALSISVLSSDWRSFAAPSRRSYCSIAGFVSPTAVSFAFWSSPSYRSTSAFALRSSVCKSESRACCSCANVAFSPNAADAPPNAISSFSISAVNSGTRARAVSSSRVNCSVD